MALETSITPSPRPVASGLTRWENHQLQRGIPKYPHPVPGEPASAGSEVISLLGFGFVWLVLFFCFSFRTAHRLKGTGCPEGPRPVEANGVGVYTGDESPGEG